MSMINSGERRRSSLLSQLGRAQSKIIALEEFVRDRERQFHTAVTQLERNESVPRQPATRRRVGLTQELLRMHSIASTEEDASCENEKGTLYLFVWSAFTD